MSTCSLLKNRTTRPDHDAGAVASGLRRIRRLPSSRAPTLVLENQLASPLTIQHTSTLPISTASSRSASRSVSRSASTSQFFVSGPVSPALEDLQRFPTESLHSFSFARQSEDFLHSRQAIVQKSIEFVRDHKILRSNLGLVNAHAKVSGDTELQGVMDLIKRAKLAPALSVRTGDSRGMSLGPLTGPANFDGRNIFDQSFSAAAAAADDSDDESEKLEMPVSSSPVIEKSVPEILAAREEFDSNSQPPSPGPLRRAGLKRTYTDVNLASLQQTLAETLAQPYNNEETKLTQGSNAVSFLPGAPAPSNSASQLVHSHSSKWTPPAQAFFRTDADTPWTIVAANDLACLTFGVTRAEVRTLSILGLIQQERRQWLENRLRPPEPVVESPQSIEVANSPNGHISNIGAKGGITARLLSKAPSRVVKTQASKNGSAIPPKPVPSPAPKNHVPRKSRGVLLCGEILPIQKRNGTIGAASFWVMEKRGGLIWVVEEVIEDVAYLQYDSSRRLAGSSGDTENIWGETLRSGAKLRFLIPKLSFEDMDNPVFDGEPILGHYTASTIGGVNVPTCVAKVKGKMELRVSSLPNIAGVMILHPSTFQITSSNSIFSQALFGYAESNGMHINELISNFTQILELLLQEDNNPLEEGLVVPEHSFRRARALLMLREGAENAANVFLRPSGLPAKHSDGSDIMVDVQMRVVRSETIFPVSTEDVIIEEGNDEISQKQFAVSETVLALWVTYSRQMHSASMGVVRPEHPLMSRPATPPHQPPPPEALPSPPHTAEPVRYMDIPVSQHASHDVSPAEPLEHPPPNTPFVAHEKKKIDDFVILENMGSGAYGEVKLARYKTSRNSKVVIKYVTKRKILVDTWIRDRRLGTTPLEIHVLDFLRREGYQHPNIVEMVDFFEDDVNYYIEMVPHGLPGMDLFVCDPFHASRGTSQVLIDLMQDYIELRMGMQEPECRHIFQQVVSAIHHLHVKAKIVHRDIKDENVVLDGENRVKLIDFGSAAYIRSGPFDVFVGTIDYAAPEVLQGRAYAGPEQDVWALGILLYTIVFKENPFYNIDEILDHPLRLPPLEDPYSDDCIDLIQAMLNRDVEERLNIEDVKNHPWMTVGDSE